MRPLTCLVVGEPEVISSPIEWLLEPGKTCVSGEVIGVEAGLSTIPVKERA